MANTLCIVCSPFDLAAVASVFEHCEAKNCDEKKMRNKPFVTVCIWEMCAIICYVGGLACTFHVRRILWTGERTFKVRQIDCMLELVHLSDHRLNTNTKKKMVNMGEKSTVEKHTHTGTHRERNSSIRERFQWYAQRSCEWRMCDDATICCRAHFNGRTDSSRCAAEMKIQSKQNGFAHRRIFYVCVVSIRSCRMKKKKVDPKVETIHASILFHFSFFLQLKLIYRTPLHGLVPLSARCHLRIHSISGARFWRRRRLVII